MSSILAIAHTGLSPPSLVALPPMAAKSRYLLRVPSLRHAISSSSSIRLAAYPLAITAESISSK